MARGVVGCSPSSRGKNGGRKKSAAGVGRGVRNTSIVWGNANCFLTR